ncbi:MAG: MFS transporter [Deinococcales bacterium]
MDSKTEAQTIPNPSLSTSDPTLPENAAFKITAVLFLGQAIGSSAIVNIGTIGSIIASDTISERWSGLPSALHGIGAAIAAFGLGTLMSHWGRRNSLVLGLTVGAVGAVIVTLGLMRSQLSAFIIGLLILGAGKASIDFGRFIAGEVYELKKRGRAVSAVVMGGTIGAVLGPFINGPLTQLSERLGLYQYLGVFMLPILIFALIALVYNFFLRPEPGLVAAHITKSEQKPDQKNRSLREIFSNPAVLTAMMAMIVGQTVMVMIMVVTAVHMKHHDHTPTNIAAVISSHTFGMFAFSMLTGILLDRFGRAAVISAGALILLTAALLAPLSLHLVPLALALFLLGLGWNFCFVGGSTLLADQLSGLERTRIQGINDLLISGISAIAGLGSGFLFASVGYAIMGYIGAIASLIPLFTTLSLWLRERNLKLGLNT